MDKILYHHIGCHLMVLGDEWQTLNSFIRLTGEVHKMQKMYKKCKSMPLLFPEEANIYEHCQHF